MKYLFFDIECSDGKHMCSFGYVVVDKNFEILEKKDIIMNPEWRFKLGRDGFNPKCDLAYSVEEFKSQPNFKHYYEKIKNILLSNGNVVLGHAVLSDLSFLKFACERYNLSQIEIEAYDTQNFYYQYNKKFKSRGLEKIIEDLEIDISNLHEHKSCDDAEISMLITKEICKRLEITIEEVLELCKDSLRCVKKDKKKSSLKNSMEIAFKQAFIEKGVNLKDYKTLFVD